MKKNKMMRLASGLLVLALLTTGIIGGTLAKYTTLNSANDSARVAKWGVMVEVAGNLFGADYGSNSAATDAEKNSIVAGTSTNVHADENVVAPGTKNDTGLTVKIGGTSEVAYEIKAEKVGEVKDIFLAAGDWGIMVEVTGLNTTSDVTGYYTEAGGTYTEATGNWVNGTKYYKLIDPATVADDGYYPINWKVAKTGSTVDISEYRNLSDSFDAMKNGIGTGTHDVGSTVNASYTLMWEWPYESGTGSNKGANDGADTILGNLMAGPMANATVVKKNADGVTYAAPGADDYNLEVAFGMKVTATQVD